MQANHQQMTLREWISDQPTPALVLWIAAILFVGFALADIPLLGLDPATLAVLAAVFAASTAVYSR